MGRPPIKCPGVPHVQRSHPLRWPYFSEGLDQLWPGKWPRRPPSPIPRKYVCLKSKRPNSRAVASLAYSRIGPSDRLTCKLSGSCCFGFCWKNFLACQQKKFRPKIGRLNRSQLIERFQKKCFQLFSTPAGFLAGSPIFCQTIIIVLCDLCEK